VGQDSKGTGGLLGVISQIAGGRCECPGELPNARDPGIPDEDQRGTENLSVPGGKGKKTRDLLKKKKNRASERGNQPKKPGGYHPGRWGRGYGMGERLGRSSPGTRGHQARVRVPSADVRDPPLTGTRVGSGT